MIFLHQVLVVSTQFSQVLLIESEGAAIDGEPVVDEGAPGGDALRVMLQELSRLQEEMRVEWHEALRQLERRTKKMVGRKLQKVEKEEEDEAARVQSVERRIEAMEARLSAAAREKLDCAGGRGAGGRLEGRLSRLESCGHSALKECSPAGTPPPSTSSSLSSIGDSSTTSSPSSVSSPASSSTYSTSTPTSASSPASPWTPFTLTSATPTSTSASTPAPSPSEESEPLPSRADPALRRALGHDLIRATWKGNLEKVKQLDHDAVPSYVADYRNTSVMAASIVGHASVISLLLRRGATAHAAHIDGMTALHFAAYDRSARVVALLAAAGALVDCRSSWESAPLHLAALRDNEAAVRALLAAGASKTLKDDDGRAPLDLATDAAVLRLLRP